METAFKEPRLVLYSPSADELDYGRTTTIPRTITSTNNDTPHSAIVAATAAAVAAARRRRFPPRFSFSDDSSVLTPVPKDVLVQQGQCSVTSEITDQHHQHDHQDQEYQSQYNLCNNHSFPEKILVENEEILHLKRRLEAIKERRARLKMKQVSSIFEQNPVTKPQQQPELEPAKESPATPVTGIKRDGPVADIAMSDNPTAPDNAPPLSALSLKSAAVSTCRTFDETIETTSLESLYKTNHPSINSNSNQNTSWTLSRLLCTAEKQGLNNGSRQIRAVRSMEVFNDETRRPVADHSVFSPQYSQSPGIAAGDDLPVPGKAYSEIISESSHMGSSRPASLSCLTRKPWYMRSTKSYEGLSYDEESRTMHAVVFLTNRKS
jgi:hypothetical protein